MLCYIILETSNFCHEESSDENSDSSESDDDIGSVDPRNASTTNSQNVIKMLKETIYNSLVTYWDQPIMTGLLATLLDPRLKMLSNWDEKIQEKARTELTSQFNELINSNSAQSSSQINSLNKSSSVSHQGSLYSSIFGKKSAIQKSVSELDHYLDPILTPIADDNVNPFEWWASRKTQFPNVAKLARKYLSIPASSAPSERLFSDAGNLITSERTRLDPKLVEKMMFIRKNYDSIQN
jgi:hypothetical protein